MFDLERPSNNFARVRDGRESMPLWMDVDLSTARSLTGTGANAPLILNIAGNSFYVDADTTNTGNAVIHFQDATIGNASAPMFISPGFIANVPFTQLLIENLAQPGKRLRIFYGVDIDFQAGVNASISIAGTVTIGNSVTVRAEAYNGSYSSAVALAALTPATIIAPGANVNGAILQSGSILHTNSSGLGSFAILAKTSAPVSTTDGDILLTPQFYVGAYLGLATLPKDIFIPAGKGVYFIAQYAETAAQRGCNYKLL